MYSSSTNQQSSVTTLKSVGLVTLSIGYVLAFITKGSVCITFSSVGS